MLSEESYRQAEAIVRFAEEMDRRLAEEGISGVSDLLERHAEFQRALAPLSSGELGAAAKRMEDLVQALLRLRADLQRLMALKSSLEVRH